MPTTSASIAIFILTVLPGIVLELLRRTARPGREESVFLESSRVLMGGVVLSTAALACLGGVRTLVGHPIADPRLLLTQQNYLPDHLWTVVFDVALFIGVSSTLAALFYATFLYGGLGGRVAPESAWITVFARLAARVQAENVDALRGKTLVTQIQADLVDGTGLVGTRESYSADADLGGRELVLSKPLFTVSADGELTPMAESWQRVILTNDKISAIRVKFSAVDNTKAGPAHRLDKPSAWTMAQRFARKAGRDPRYLVGLLLVQLMIPLTIGWLS